MRALCIYNVMCILSANKMLILVSGEAGLLTNEEQ